MDWVRVMNTQTYKHMQLRDKQNCDTEPSSHCHIQMDVPYIPASLLISTLVTRSSMIMLTRTVQTIRSPQQTLVGCERANRQTSLPYSPQTDLRRQAAGREGQREGGRNARGREGRREGGREGRKEGGREREEGRGKE